MIQGEISNLSFASEGLFKEFLLLPLMTDSHLVGLLGWELWTTHAPQAPEKTLEFSSRAQEEMCHMPWNWRTGTDLGAEKEAGKPEI